MAGACFKCAAGTAVSIVSKSSFVLCVKTFHFALQSRASIFAFIYFFPRFVGEKSFRNIEISCTVNFIKVNFN